MFELLQPHSLLFQQTFDCLPNDDERRRLADLQLGTHRHTMLHILAALADVESEDWRVVACSVLARWTSSVKDKAGRTAFEVGSMAPSKKIKDFFDSRLLVVRRFCLDRKVHDSDTCIVFYASEIKARDGTSHEDPRLVALKFMLNRKQFERELQGRKLLGLENEECQYILDVIDYYEDVDFERAELKAYRYCLVMPRGDRTLHDAILHDNFAGKSKQLNLVQHIMRFVAEALRFLHQKQIIHADLKPLNIIRVGELWMLIDLDAAVKLGQPAGVKVSKAVLPPEMFEEVGRTAGENPMCEWSAEEVVQWVDALTEVDSGESCFCRRGL